MKPLAVIAALIGLAVAVYLGTHHRAPKSPPSPPTKSSAPAPALTFTDLNGTQVQTSSYAGKVVLVNFWAAWCTPCAQEVPQIIALQNKYGTQDFQVIGISMDDQPNALHDFYQKYKMNYPVTAGTQQIAESYGGILGLPTTILITRDGHIHSKVSGQIDFPKIEQEITALLR